MTLKDSYIPLRSLNLNTIEDLEYHARAYSTLREDGNISLCPEMHMPRALGEAIDGTFGLQLIDQATEEARPVAMMGFDIQDSTMIITQTPTGLAPDELTSEQKDLLRRSNFRSTMIQSAIDLAYQLDMDVVLGYSVASHPSIWQKIGNEEITEAQAIKVLDTVYEQTGFSRTWDDRYILYLNNQN
jgi:hypothetical protein